MVVIMSPKTQDKTDSEFFPASDSAMKMSTPLQCINDHTPLRKVEFHSKKRINTMPETSDKVNIDMSTPYNDFK